MQLAGQPQAPNIIIRGSGSSLAAASVQERLESQYEAFSEDSFVCVGDIVPTDMQEGFLRGHGTQVVDGQLMATVCGRVERINKLVSVRPLRNRYSAELGDVVVGRVTDVAGKRWIVDLNARQEATLQLSSVNLPGGVQRRRTAEDELNMRSVFEEGDLISAEVQALHQDGSVSLHTRSLKYGKLAGGQLVTVPANLIKRQKHHFNTLPDMGVDVILGCNGMVWVAPNAPPPALGADGEPEQAPPRPPATREQRAAVCRMAGALRALAALYFPIFQATLVDAYQARKPGLVDAA
ncbi:hypothetical protein WJX81_004480 [Elliptochloris bilobata]|uniref:S1 motif domain-containing protein n=1 Tax=Elliptochloris bilobata TaxID=381761 RepID=A0AAW1RKC7_9CHLO